MARKSCWSYIHWAFITLALMNIINIVGYITPAWAKSYYGIHWIEADLRPQLVEGPSMWVGLWFRCTSEKPNQPTTTASTTLTSTSTSATTLASTTALLTIGCPSFSEVSSSLHASRAFVTLGVISLLLALVAMGFYYYSKTKKNSPFMVAGVCLFVGIGSLFLGIGGILFGKFLADYQATLIRHHQYLDLQLHYSFALCMTAAVISLMNLMYFYMDHNGRNGHQ